MNIKILVSCIFAFLSLIGILILILILIWCLFYKKESYQQNIMKEDFSPQDITKYLENLSNQAETAEIKYGMQAQHGFGDFFIGLGKDIGNIFTKVGEGIKVIAVGVWDAVKKIRDPIDMFKALTKVVSIAGGEIIKVGGSTIDLAGSTIGDVVQVASFGTIPRKGTDFLTGMVKDKFITKTNLYVAIANGDLEKTYNIFRDKYNAKAKLGGVINDTPEWLKPFLKDIHGAVPDLPTFNDLFGSDYKTLARQITYYQQDSKIDYDFSYGSIDCCYLKSNPKIEGTVQECIKKCESEPDCHQFQRTRLVPENQKAPCWLQTEAALSSVASAATQWATGKDTYTRPFQKVKKTTLPPYNRQDWTVVGYNHPDLTFINSEDMEKCKQYCNFRQDCAGFTRDDLKTGPGAIKCYFKTEFPESERIRSNVITNQIVRLSSDTDFRVGQLMFIFNNKTFKYDSKGRINSINSNGTYNLTLENGTKINNIPKSSLSNAQEKIYANPRDEEWQTSAYLKPLTTTPVPTTTPVFTTPVTTTTLAPTTPSTTISSVQPKLFKINDCVNVKHSGHTGIITNITETVFGKVYTIKSSNGVEAKSLAESMFLSNNCSPLVTTTTMRPRISFGLRNCVDVLSGKSSGFTGRITKITNQPFGTVYTVTNSKNNSVDVLNHEIEYSNKCPPL